MKEQLKTLKDFPKSYQYWFDVSGLRVEAIKWIKLINAENKRDANINVMPKQAKQIEPFLGCGCCDSNELVVNWIKHFFNISEEELKNEVEKIE